MVVLTGTEIKSVRAARINLKDGFAQVKNGEVWLSNVHIAPYEEGNIWNQEPERRRKLLLHKKQIQKLEQETKGTGMTLVPLKVYIKDGYAKLLLGLAKGKHDYDKRESIKRREQNRDIARVMKAVKPALRRGSKMEKLIAYKRMPLWNKQTMPESQKKELFSARYYLYGKWRICLCLLLFHAGRKV